MGLGTEGSRISDLKEKLRKLKAEINHLEGRVLYLEIKHKEANPLPKPVREPDPTLPDC